MALDSITSETVAAYAAHRQSRALVASSVNRELRVLRRVLRLAVEWGILERVPKVQMLRGEKRRERVVGEQEFLRYVSCAAAVLADVARTLNDTGMRPDECHRVRWDEIDWQGRYGLVLVSEGKTPAARRRIPLTPQLRAVFEARWKATGEPREGFVWPSATKSGHIGHSTLKK